MSGTSPPSTLDDATACDFIETQNVLGLIKAVIHDPSALRGWKLIAECLKKVRNSCSKEVIDLCERAILSSHEALVLKEDLEARQSAEQCSAFKEVVEYVFFHKNRVISVSGDGNCFFRSVAQSLFSPGALELPKAYESEYAQYLREESTKIGMFDDYIETDDAEQKVMENTGTWASSVQIARMSKFLQCPIHVLRYDDPGITFDFEKRVILPSSLYQYNEGVEGLPILLIYEPYPGHYSSVSVRNEVNCNGMLAFEKFCSEMTAFNCCQVFLNIESERKEMIQLSKDPEKTDKTIKNAIMDSLNERKEKLLDLVAKFKNMLAETCNLRDMQEKTPPRDILALKLFEEMLDDDIFFVDGEKDPLACGKGPITELFQGIKNLNKTQPSYMTPKEVPSSSSIPPPSGGHTSRTTTTKVYSGKEQQQEQTVKSGAFYQGIYLPEEDKEKDFGKEPPKQVAKKGDPIPSATKPLSCEKKRPEQLLECYNTDENEWKGVTMGNMIQVRAITVNAESLRTLLSAIADKTLKNITNITFYLCEINSGCYETISSFAGRKKGMTFEFEDCTFDISLKKRIEGRKEKNIIVSENVNYIIKIL